MPPPFDARAEQGAQDLFGLSVSERDWSAILEGLRFCVFCKDRNLRYTIVNPAMTALLGVPAERMLGKTDAELWPHEIAGKLEDVDRSVLSGLPVQTEVTRIVNGHVHAFHSIRLPRRKADGEVVGLWGIDRDVTELQSAGQRLRALVSNCPLAVIEWDGHHHVVSWSGSAEHMFGWEASEVLGKRLDEWRFVYEEDWEFVRTAMNAMEQGRKFISHNRNYRKDGSLIECEWYNSVLADQTGGYGGGLSLVVDVTERKRMEEALRRSEEKYRRIVETAPIGIFRSTLEGRFLSLNSKLANLFGYDSPAEMLAAIHDIATQLFVHPEVRPGMIRRAVESREFIREEVEYRCRDGSTFLSNLYLRAVRDGEGVAEFMEGFVEDITERKQAEEALLFSEEKYRQIVETAPIGIFRSTLAGRFLTANAKAAELFGYRSPGELMAAIHDLASQAYVHPEQRNAIVRRAVESPDFVRGEVEYRRRDGSTFSIDLHIRAVRDGAGQVAYLEGFGEDITERRRAEQALREAHDALEARVQERTLELSAANDRLQELDRLKSQFLASMSHELRTPLNSIIGFTSLLLQGLTGPVNAEQTRQLEIIQSSGKHLLALINDLLDISRIEAGRADLQREPFDFMDVVDEVIRSLKPMADRKGLEVKTETPALRIPMLGDRKRTMQVLLNLVNNAIKFTQAGHVRITAAVEPSLLRVAVADTGIGIRAEHLGMLFEAFRQVDGSAKRVYEGTGLGLYLCRRLLGLMGGEIRVESECGVGSCFTFTIPLELAGESPGTPGR